MSVQEMIDEMTRHGLMAKWENFMRQNGQENA